MSLSLPPSESRTHSPQARTHARAPADTATGLVAPPLTRTKRTDTREVGGLKRRMRGTYTSYRCCVWRQILPTPSFLPSCCTCSNIEENKEARKYGHTLCSTLLFPPSHFKNTSQGEMEICSILQVSCYIYCLLELSLTSHKPNDFSYSRETVIISMS